MKKQCTAYKDSMLIPKFQWCRKAFAYIGRQYDLYQCPQLILQKKTCAPTNYSVTYVQVIFHIRTRNFAIHSDAKTYQNLVIIDS